MSTEPSTVEGRVRADPLSYPTPTTARVVVLLVALLGGGLFLGWWTFNATLGDRWAAQIQACGPLGLDVPAAVARCQAGPEEQRALFALGGALAMVVGGVGVLLLLPALVTRRRHLRPMPTAMQATWARVRELADEAGVRSPTVMVGPSTQREAFCYGLPGRYRVVLPLRAALRPADTALFDPLLRHELAHLRHHDVLAAWLARSVWYTYLPLALVPILVSAAHRDASVAVDYVWRAILLLSVVRLVTNAILRSREHDADLAAGRGADRRAALVALLGTSPAADDAPPTRWRVLRSQHPTIRHRLEVLADPGLAVRATPVDAFTSALLVATVTPVATSVFVGALSGLGTGGVGYALVVVSLVVGVPLGAAVGLGLWRSDTFGRLGGSRMPVAPVAWSVGAGLAVGSVLSPSAGRSLSLWSLLVAVLVGLGATTVVAGAGRLWADAAPGIRAVRTHWVAALVVAAVVFGAAVASATLVTEGAVDLGWSAFLAAQLSTPLSWPYCLALLVVAGLVVVALRLRRAGSTAPPWVLAEGSPPPWPVPAGPSLWGAVACGVAAGVAVALTIVVIEQLAPIDPRADPQGWTDRVVMQPAAAGLAGVCAMAALALVARLRGAGAAALASTVAVLVATLVGAISAELGLGGAWGWDSIVHAGRVAAATATALSLPVAALALVGRRPVGGARTRASALLATALAVLASGTLVLAGPTGLEQFDRAVSGLLAAQQYQQQVAIPVRLQVLQVSTLVGSLGGQTDDVVSRRLRDEVLPQLDAALTTARSARPAASEAELHGRLLDSLRRLRDSYAAIVDGVDAGDQQAVTSGVADRDAAMADFDAWARDAEAQAQTGTP